MTKALNVFTCPLDGVNLIEASAGTGKTWNICGLYLRLLLEKAIPVDQILVVTFTKAATAELRERIRSRLQEMQRALRQPDDAITDLFARDLLAALSLQGGLDRQVLAQRLESALLGFDQASIATIHGFCQRALADVPFSAGQAFDIELLPDDTLLLAETAADFWRCHVATALTDPGLINYLIDKNFTPEFLARQIGRRVSKPLACYCWPEQEAVSEAPDYSALQQQFKRTRACWTAQHQAAGDYLLTQFPGRAHGGSYKPASIQQGLDDWDAYFARGDVHGVISKEQRLLTRNTLIEKKTGKGEALSHPLFDCLDDYLQQRESLLQYYEQQRLQLLQCALTQGPLCFREKKAQRRLASYDDLLSNLYDALMSPDLPELASKLKTRFPCALIDEFQDTDPLQFGIFKKIYGESGPLFLVGDPKQAIYGFRNADIFTYLHAKDGASACYSLGDNQRSTKALIEGVNGLFQANTAAFMLDGFPPYQPVRFGQKPRSTLRDQTRHTADLTLWHLPLDAAGQVRLKSDARALAVQATAAEISRLLQAAAEGQLVLQAPGEGGEQRPVKAGDIAVLVRSHAQGSAIKQALQTLGVGSIELSQARVFDSLQAEELYYLLQAIAEPSRAKLVLAALATEVMGKTASDIAAIAASDSLLAGQMTRFADYRTLAQRKGFGVLWQTLLNDFAVAQRFLQFADGERRLTNLRHLGELLQQAAARLIGLDELIRWLAEQRSSDSSGNESAQLRLESDANLVQIVTVHKSKGLEYPIVFCPFFWDSWLGTPGGNLEGREYHDAQRDLRVDFNGDSGKAEARLEAAAEQVRLIYVGLTRAVHRCYLVLGSYAQKSGRSQTSLPSSRSILNWLVAGEGMDAASWLENKKTPPEILACWQAWLTTLPPDLASLGEIPACPGQPLRQPETTGGKFSTPPLPPLSLPVWRMGSFTSLNQALVRDDEARPDRDSALSEHDTLPAMTTPPALPRNDILHFPRGALPGEAIHALFEKIDFSDDSTWPTFIKHVLQEYPLPSHGENQADPATMLATLLPSVLTTPLPAGFTLASIGPQHRFVEMEFSFPARQVDANRLNALLRAHRIDQPPLAFRELNGYLKGFIDLIFMHQGRYYLVDWKSNHLGWTPEAYAHDALATAMREHGYHLQYLLYTLALHRFLRHRLPGYAYSQHFGGVNYLFVRAVRPDWRHDGQPTGIFSCRPAEALIEALDHLFAAHPHAPPSLAAAETIASHAEACHE